MRYSLLLLTLLSVASFAQQIKLNQVAFHTTSIKHAVVPASKATRFHLIDNKGNKVFEDSLSAAKVWPYSKENVQIADFTNFSTKGQFMVVVDGVGSSYLFDIKENAYLDLSRASIKAFYYNRASTDIPQEFGGIDARKAGHPDTSVYVHWSAADNKRPEGTVLSGPKGWYDAGDYNKYIVNSGISTYSILAAYEHYSPMLDTLTWNIPESNNELPDVLDEALWNLDWMLTMQDPNDGGVYHKLTTLKFSGHEMPHLTTEKRYVVQKSTAAALDYAAVMAQASRIFSKYEAQRPGYSKRCLESALAAWKWARANPKVYFKNPSDVFTGEYGDNDVKDEFTWAACELYITTKADSFYTASNIISLSESVPTWQNVGSLSLISLSFHKDNLTPIADKNAIDMKLDRLTKRLVKTHKESAYRVSMGSSRGDFNWGSNGYALTESMILAHTYNITQNKDYLDAAQSNVNYILGQNGPGISFVTGFGTVSPQNPHHRPSMGDYKLTPVPGFVVGGPNALQQDKCEGYPSNLPALSYVDSECSYASNEIAINWNAPLFYSVAALHALTGISHEEIWIETQAKDLTACYPDSTTTSIKTSGANVAYQWEVSSNGKTFKKAKEGKGFTGTTTASLSLLAPKKGKTIFVRCVVSDNKTKASVNSQVTKVSGGSCN